MKMSTPGSSGHRSQPYRYPPFAQTTTRAPARNRVRPHFFLLKWNNSHMRTSDPNKFNWHQCWGTLYPNGRVTLDSGSPFATLNELKEHVGQAGVFFLQWQHELEAGEAPEGFDREEEWGE